MERLTELRRLLFRSINDRTLPLLVRFAALCLPVRFWYGASLWLSRALAPPVRLCRSHPHDRVLEARILDYLLTLFSATRQPFAIPYRIEGEAIVLSAVSSGSGAVFCSGHIPLTGVAIRALIDISGVTPVAIAARKDGNLDVPGLPEGIPTIPINAHVLVKTRTLLRSGRMVLMLADRYTGGTMESNIFRLVGRVPQAHIVLITTELETDGVVKVSFLHPRDAFCTTEIAVQRNLEALSARIAAILNGKRIATVPPPAPGDAPTASEPDRLTA